MSDIQLLVTVRTRDDDPSVPEHVLEAVSEILKGDEGGYWFRFFTRAGFQAVGVEVVSQPVREDDGDALLVDSQGRRVCEDEHLCGSGCGTGPCSRRCQVCRRLAFVLTAPCPACPDAAIR